MLDTEAPVTFEAMSEWAIWMLRASMTVVSEMPAEAPSERNRFRRLDPSVLRRGGRVPNALTLSGMKTSPMPRP